MSHRYVILGALPAAELVDRPGIDSELAHGGLEPFIGQANGDKGDQEPSVADGFCPCET